METGRRIVEDPCGHRLRPHLGQVKQPSQGVCVGDRQVIRGQHPDLGSPVQRIYQAAMDLLNPGLHDEADQQVHAVEAGIAQAPQNIAQQPVLPVDQLIWFRSGLQVVALALYDMPHTAARVRHITAVARDDVDMQVPDSLPGGRAGVEADVIAVGRATQCRAGASTSSTKARMSARSASVASHQVAITRRETTRACPGLTGKRSAMTNAERFAASHSEAGTAEMASHCRACSLPYRSMSERTPYAVCTAQKSTVKDNPVIVQSSPSWGAAVRGRVRLRLTLPSVPDSRSIITPGPGPSVLGRLTSVTRP